MEKEKMKKKQEEYLHNLLRQKQRILATKTQTCFDIFANYLRTEKQQWCGLSNSQRHKSTACDDNACFCSSTYSKIFRANISATTLDPTQALSPISRYQIPKLYHQIQVHHECFMTFLKEAHQ